VEGMRFQAGVGIKYAYMGDAELWERVKGKN
jgi:hypothetical protein